MTTSFEKYAKVRRLGDRENRGILEGTVVAQEKLDGAQASIICQTDSSWDIASRNQLIPADSDFRGFRSYVKAHKGLQALIDSGCVARIYGEWLVKHSISYPDDAYNQFYVYDIDYYDEGEIKRCSFIEYSEICDDYGLLTPALFYLGDTATVGHFVELAGVSAFDIPFGEGLVIRNDSFSKTTRAKVVTPRFEEVSKNKVKTPRDYSQISTVDVNDWAETHCTKRRVEKIVQKFLLENDLEEPTRTITGKILPLCVEDTITEELDNWKENNPEEALDAKELKKALGQCARNHFFTIVDTEVN